MNGVSITKPSKSASNRMRRLELRRLKPGDRGAEMEFEPAKTTRGSDSNSDQVSSDDSSRTFCSSHKEKLKVRSCGHGAVSVIGAFLTNKSF
jgi:hypothetical protein